ncbi:hypothetical protein [Streptomyces sp. SJL17-4]|uniref:hypothetical protein n=1 Tax=Streptomyces sp. SJL17-4 TaxID=2967224 RepID=UPI0030D6008A
MSAAPAQDPATPQPDPTEPAPEPSATTDPPPEPTPTPTVDPSPNPTEPAEPTAEPTPNPTDSTEPTAEPTPNPTDSTEPTVEPTPSTEPTADPCPVLPLAPLGDPGDAMRRVTMEPNSTLCFTVTVEKPGLHRVLVAGGVPSLSFSSGGTRVACFSLDMSPCELAAGTYTLGLATSGYRLSDTRLAVVPLMAGPGCPDPADSGFGTAPTTGTANEVGLLCHSFTSAPGELITTELRPQAGSPANVDAWVTDGTGKRLCSVGYDCVLPAGTGEYRVLAHLNPSAGSYPVPYTLKVRQVSHPVGCATVGVNAYGTAPTQVSPPTECKTFTPATTGRYEVRAIQPSGVSGSLTVYAPGGRICEYVTSCQLVAGITYTLITDQAVRILDWRSAAEGCENVPLGQPHRAGIGAPAEVDCVNLPAPQGSRVAILTAPEENGVKPDISVIDATGALLCWTEESLSSGTCALNGTAPYSALVKSGHQGEATGGYGLTVHRTDVASDCRTFPAGDFTAHPARVTVRTGDGVFGDCLTIPAADHSTRELIRVESLHSLGFSVLDETGRRVCGANQEDCALAPGLSHTVLVSGSLGGTPVEHTLVRRDVTATARGCVATPAAKVGAPSVSGALAEDGTLVCHRVTTTDARDTLHLDARYTTAGHATGHGVYDAQGRAACEDFGAGCAVSGSTGYQAIVEVGSGGATTPAYRLDAVRIGTATGPAPECVRIPDVTYGFGPLVGTLSEQRSTLCAVLPTATNDVLKLSFAPVQELRKSPTPRLYGAARSDLCYGSWRGYYDCQVPGESYEYVARPTTLLIGLPSVPPQAPTEVRASAVCSPTCGTVTRTVTAVSPGTVGAGRITMTVTGAALHEKDVVEVSGGSFRARSTTVSVAPDRRSMSVALDLTSAPRTALNLNVVTHDGYTYARGRVTVVAPIRATAAPGITGTVVVGGKVTAKAGTWTPTAESYAYQWRANGVAIAGATASTYTIPATLQGKQLSLAVTARKAGHPLVTATSSALVVKGVAPKPTKLPYVSGSTRVGNRMTAVVGTWSPAPTSYAYQWRANGVAISGATGSTYVIGGAVAGKKLSVTVTAHRTGHLSGAYTTVGYTSAYGYAPKATTAPYTTGTVRVGRTLSLNRGTWTPAPTSYAYQWYANGRAITGATKTTFTLTAAQRGTRITVKVTAHRTGHASGVAWTRATAAVAG